MNIGDHIAGKLTSGRMVMTVSVALSFLMFSLSVCACLIIQSHSLTAALIVALFGQLMLVVQNVFKDYFNRKDRQIKNEV